MLAVRTENLAKTYVAHKKEPGLWGAVRGLFTREKVEVHAVKDVNLSLSMGERVGFLGPNGAGKTTTLKMLTGILHPTSGIAEVLGYVPFRRDPAMLRQISLVVGNRQQLWWDLPARESFLVLKELYEVEDAAYRRRLDRLVESLSLADKIDVQVRKLSLGERMKCELVAALLHAPRVVFLDEPTLGLDVVSQKRIREFLIDLHREEGNTLLLTSHYMQDVQEICERVVIIDHGKVVFEGTLDQLARLHGETRQIRVALERPVERADLEALGKVREVGEDSAVLEIPRADTAAAMAAILRDLPVADVSMQETDIEDVIRDLFTREADVPRETSP
jgi:ABC-2 type transport system ATP-binding protein